MDTTRDIEFRGFLLNDSSILDNIDPDTGIGKGITGSVVDSWDDSDTDVVAFLEKRSQQDGMDAGPPFLGGRRLRMAGTLYGKTRNLLFDQYLALRAILSPTLASREEPAAFGFRPLNFSIPTNRIDDYPGSEIALMYQCLPKQKQLVWQRDQQGGADSDSLAIPWQATFVLRDPALTAQDPVDLTFDATTVVTGATATASTDLVNKTAHGLSAGTRIYFTTLTGGTGLALNTSYYVIASGLTADVFKVSLTAGGSAVNILTNYSAVSYALAVTLSDDFANRGNYHVPLNILLAVGAQAGSVSVVAGDSAFTINVPASTGSRILRYKGADKLLFLEENSVDGLRMDLFVLPGDNQHPLIPGGASPYIFTFTGLTVEAGSHAWFYETYA